MTTLVRPQDIVAEFLRARLTDPRSRLTAESDSFTATSGQTTFTLTPATSAHLVRAITGVTVDGNDTKKWQEYTINLIGKSITLKTGATLDDAVVVNYRSSATGEDWIFPDFPISSLSKTKFPRISVNLIDRPGTRNGPFDASVTHLGLFQTDVYTKDGYSKVIAGKNYTKQDLAEYLALQVDNQLITNIDDLFDQLTDFEGVNFSNMPFEEAAQRYRHMQQFILSGTNMGH